LLAPGVFHAMPGTFGLDSCFTKYGIIVLCTPNLFCHIFRMKKCEKMRQNKFSGKSYNTYFTKQRPKHPGRQGKTPAASKSPHETPQAMPTPRKPIYTRLFLWSPARTKKKTAIWCSTAFHKLFYWLPPETAATRIATRPPALLWPMSLRAHAYTQTPVSCEYFAEQDIFPEEVFKQFQPNETHTENSIFFSI
jgi:hypothetical protein